MIACPHTKFVVDRCLCLRNMVKRPRVFSMVYVQNGPVYRDSVSLKGNEKTKELLTYTSAWNSLS